MSGPEAGLSDFRNAGPVTVLETERLLLSHLSVNDTEFILELLNDPAFLEFVGDKGVRTLDDAREYILTGPVDSYKRHGFGLYMARLKVGGAPIGICGLVKRESLEDADIGFGLLPAFRGKGYAIEAAAAVLEHARAALGFSRILAVTSPDNHGSIRILKKLGLRFEKMISLSDDDPDIKLFVSDART
ncbi:MAG: GNAT family N-acetyltransferase [Gammaproteobacteria bacterium]